MRTLSTHGQGTVDASKRRLIPARSYRHSALCLVPPAKYRHALRDSRQRAGGAVKTVIPARKAFSRDYASHVRGVHADLEVPGVWRDRGQNGAVTGQQDSRCHPLMHGCSPRTSGRGAQVYRERLVIFLFV